LQDGFTDMMAMLLQQITRIQNNVYGDLNEFSETVNQQQFRKSLFLTSEVPRELSLKKLILFHR